MIIASLYPCPYDAQERHDFNAAVLADGRIFAYEDAKLTGIKQENTARHAERSLMMGLRELRIEPEAVDLWVFPTPRDAPRMRDHYMFFAGVLKAYLGPEAEFSDWFAQRVRFVPHHVGHASLGIFASGFESCAFLSQDGGGDLGDPRDMIFGEFSNGQVTVLAEHRGLFNVCSYHAFITDAVGFSGGENGKTSGLASYGRFIPALADKLRQTLHLDDEGIHFSRARYSRTRVNLQRVRPQEYERDKIFNRVPSDTNVFRLSLEYLPQDIAATGEQVMREVVLAHLRRIREKTRAARIVFSGGLFQNVALNRAILDSGMFEEYFFPMAPSDGGIALGAALYVQNETRGPRSSPRASEPMSPFLGPSFDGDEVKALLDRFRLNYTEVERPPAAAARMIADGQIVGWFQGRAEYGPRSLGARSILADPRDLHSKRRLNLRLKRRDWFMPFAPSILEEDYQDWATSPHYSPYMQVALTVGEGRRDQIPAAVHVDGTARFHVVRRAKNPDYWDLIREFKDLTGVPMVLNTSFNRHGIPTISSPRQAIEHLLEGCMDALFIDRYLIRFEDNRLAARVPETLPDESTLLLSDCLARLKIVCGRGTAAQIDGYLGHLSHQFELESRRESGRVYVAGQTPIEVGNAAQKPSAVKAEAAAIDDRGLS